MNQRQNDRFCARSPNGDWHCGVTGKLTVRNNMAFIIDNNGNEKTKRGFLKRDGASVYIIDYNSKHSTLKIGEERIVFTLDDINHFRTFIFDLLAAYGEMAEKEPEKSLSVTTDGITIRS